MAGFLKIRSMYHRPILFIAAHHSNRLDRKLRSDAQVSHAHLQAKLTMNKKVCRCISANMYKSLQEHKDASRELEKIKLSKRGHALFEVMRNCRKDFSLSSRNVSQL